MIDRSRVMSENPLLRNFVFIYRKSQSNNSDAHHENADTVKAQSSKSKAKAGPEEQESDNGRKPVVSGNYQIRV